MTLLLLTSAFASVPDLSHSTPRPDLLATYLEVEGRSQVMHQLIPVVPEGWTESEPVSVWLWCDPSVHRCLEPWTWFERLQQPLGDVEVFRKGAFVGTGWPEVAKDAQLRHGLTSAPDAVVLKIREAPGWKGPTPSRPAPSERDALAWRMGLLLLAVTVLNPLALIWQLMWHGSRRAQVRPVLWLSWLISSFALSLCGVFLIGPSFFLMGPIFLGVGAYALVRGLSGPGERIPAWASVFNGGFATIFTTIYVLVRVFPALLPSKPLELASISLTQAGETGYTKIVVPDGAELLLSSSIEARCQSMVRISYEIELVPEGGVPEGGAPVTLSCESRSEAGYDRVILWSPGGPLRMQYRAPLACSSELPSDLRGPIALTATLVVDGPADVCQFDPAKLVVQRR